MSSSPSPDSVPPAGVPNSGAKRHVWIIAFLLLGIIGLAFALLRPKSQEAQRPISQAPAPAPHNESKLDEVPPPPDTPSGSDAGADNRSNPGPTTNPCDARTCGGSITQDLEGSLSFRAKQAHRCYDAALAQDSTLAGKVVIRVRIAANGTICSSTVASNDLSNAGVAQCVANTFRSGNSKFPAPRGGCIDTSIPISFKPGQ